MENYNICEIEPNKSIITTKTIIVVLVSVLAVSLSLNFFQYYMPKAANDAIIAELEQTKSELVLTRSELSQTKANLAEAKGEIVIVKNNVDSLVQDLQTAKYDFLIYKDCIADFITEWIIYRDSVALTVSPYGNTAYHLPRCSHLGGTYYIRSVDGALNAGCYPCSDCYKYADPFDEYNAAIEEFKNKTHGVLE